MRTLVLLNAAAGTLASSQTNDEAERIRARLAAQGVDVEVRPVEGADIERATTEARDSGRYEMIVAGGGDGTLNTVASVLVGSDVTFGVLPLGTFNHLAKELGMPLELDPAVDALATGRTLDFNVGEVNGKHFLLFSAIGLYSDMIRHRDAQRKALGRKKMWAGTLAFFKMVSRWPLMRVRVRLGDAPQAPYRRLTPVVYVSLSDYQMKQLGIAAESCQGREALNVALLAKSSRRGLIWAMLKATFRLLRPRKDFELVCTDRVELATRHKHIHVGIDGEVVTLENPLRYRLVRGGLKVRVPSVEAQTATAGEAVAGA